MSERSMRDKRKRLKEQNEIARDQNKIWPMESNWEDAQILSKNTRQGQNYWREHMSDLSAAMKESRQQKRIKNKRNAIADRLLNKR